MAFKQNLQGATGGTIQGAHGGTQQLGAAAQRRLQSSGQTPPIMDPAQKPPVPAWQQLAERGIGGQGSAAANRAAARDPMNGGMAVQPLPGFQPAPGGPNVFHPTNPGAIDRSGPDQMQGGAPTVPFGGRTPSFGTPGQTLGVGGQGETSDALHHPGGPFDGSPGQMPPGMSFGVNPLPGFTAAPGVQNLAQPGPPGGLPTKPLPVGNGTPIARRPPLGGGMTMGRNNMQGY